MATQLDLQEQEQLEDIKHFWKQYGNLITWTLVLALGGFAAWQGWNWWQREQSLKASAMYDELERVADAGDAARAAQAFAELKERYPRTAFAEQGGLLAAKVQFDKGQADNARAALGWVAEHAIEGEYKTVARLRLAGLLLDAKQYDEALKQLDAAKDDKAFEGLVADRRGDVLLAQGKKDDARAAYQAAYQALEPTVDYRRLVEAKLTALGAAPEAAAAASAASAGVKK
jgi:predicted negative regulator of RcsB-dependent stress response